MSSSLKQVQFLLPRLLLDEFRQLIPRGEQSQVVIEALDRELKRRKLKLSLQQAFGAWKHRKDLGSTHSLVRRLRKERVFK